MEEGGGQHRSGIRRAFIGSLDVPVPVRTAGRVQEDVLERPEDVLEHPEDVLERPETCPLTIWNRGNGVWYGVFYGWTWCQVQTVHRHLVGLPSGGIWVLHRAEDRGAYTIPRSSTRPRRFAPTVTPTLNKLACGISAFKLQLFPL